MLAPGLLFVAFLFAQTPSDPVEAQFNLALSLTTENKDAEAIVAWRRTLELSPGLYGAELNLGLVLLRSHQPADAAIALADAVAAKPSEFRPRFLRAQALFDSGAFEQAESEFRTALTIDPKSAGATIGLARTLLKQNNLADAEPLYRAAIALDPSTRSALLELGIAFDNGGNSAEAIAIFREFPANDAVSKRASELLLASNNATAAIPGLEALVARTPTTDNRLRLADAYKQAGKFDKVIEQLHLAATADSSNFDLRMALGRTLRDQRRYAEAAREFRAASGIRADSVPALNELAGSLILSGDPEGGLAALDRIKAMNREIPGDMYLRAITLDKLHRLKPALDAYREFLAAAAGKFPDDEFRARQRSRIIEHELGK